MDVEPLVEVGAADHDYAGGAGGAEETEGETAGVPGDGGLVEAGDGGVGDGDGGGGVEGVDEAAEAGTADYGNAGGEEGGWELRADVVGVGAVVDGGFPRGRLLREGGRASRNRGLSSGAKNDNYFSSYAMTAATGSDRFSNAGRAGGIPFCWRGINCLSRLALVLRLCRRWGQDANPS